MFLNTEAAAIIRDIAVAINHLHKMDIAHRDIKVSLSFLLFPFILYHKYKKVNLIFFNTHAQMVIWINLEKEA